MLCLGSICAPVAHAEENAGDSTSEQSSGVSIAIDSMTPVITNDSGLAMTLTVTNNTDSAVDQGSIDALTNFSYTFVSRSDVQDWADGSARIPLPDLLVTLHVPRIEARASVTVSSTLPASEEILKQLNSWGPRPLVLSYAADDGSQSAQLNSFITRSQDGLQGERTPQLHMTMMMPLTASAWSINNDTLKAMRAQNSAETKASSIAKLSDTTVSALRDKDKLAKQFSQLQTVADPQILSALQTPHVSALMQPADFDINMYSYVNNDGTYTKAGVQKTSWAASTATQTLRDVLKDEKASRPTYALQGSGPWNVQALNTARAQGYDTVIATHDFDNQDDDTAHTCIYSVPTDSGDVTVMSAHTLLSKLVQGTSTSSNAQAETNTAGRLQRFIAQTAFYQMEQPYEDRALLVNFGTSTSASDIYTYMEALGQASWLDLTDLQTLRSHQAYVSGDEATQVANEAGNNFDVSQYNTIALSSTLSTLTSSRQSIERFNSAVLLAGTTSSQSTDSKDSLGATQWSERWLQAHDDLALLALNANSPPGTDIAADTTSMADYLRAGVSLTTPANVNVVSESASLPVTVTNNLPYAIKLRISSRTDSMEIVTSRFVDVDVPANSETQATLKIRVSTSGTTTANQMLVNNEGVPLSGTHTTTITSQLQISDKSGLIFIAIAVLLGIVGLWRQFNRKKDPDE